MKWRPSIRGTLFESGDLNLKTWIGDGSYMMALWKNLILTKNYEMYFSMTTGDVLCEPTIPYDHITPEWEGAYS
jgi:hypothetical protein